MNKNIINYIAKFKKASAQYRQRAGVCPQLPVRLWIEPTNRCNLKCIMCPNSNPPKNAKYGDMSMELYKKVIDEASGFVVDINLFARGESLLNDKIFDMISYANLKGLRTRLETNATLLSKENSEKLLRSGLNFLSFSFDGYTKQAYEKVRVNATYEKTLSNILNFLKIKKRLKSKNPFVFIQVIEMLIVKDGINRRARSDFKRLFKGMPVNGFRFILPHRFGGVISKDVTGTDYAYMNKEGLIRNFVKMRYTTCPYPWYGMSVYYDGKVLPCCLNFFDNYVIGDANKDNLVDIWNGERMVSLREKLAAGGHKSISMCAECDFLYQTSVMGLSTKAFRDALTFIREIMND
ncbi:MAG: radical SAM protein [Candidatus Orphnella occulta]|nr:radical SAM protein [Candidatus Orphnella occulta]